jgi:hypothetical protein
MVAEPVNKLTAVFTVRVLIAEFTKADRRSLGGP